MQTWVAKSNKKKQHFDKIKDVHREKEKADVGELQKRFIDTRVKQAEHTAKNQQTLSRTEPLSGSIRTQVRIFSINVLTECK